MRALLASLLLLTLGLNGQTITITIAPAPVDRAALVADFALPEDAARPTRATKTDGTSLLVQVDDSGKGCIVVGFLRAGESLPPRLSKADGAVGESVGL